MYVGFQMLEMQVLVPGANSHVEFRNGSAPLHPCDPREHSTRGSASLVPGLFRAFTVFGQME